MSCFYAWAYYPRKQSLYSQIGLSIHPLASFLWAQGVDVGVFGYDMNSISDNATTLR